MPSSQQKCANQVVVFVGSGYCPPDGLQSEMVPSTRTRGVYSVGWTNLGNAIGCNGNTASVTLGKNDNSATLKFSDFQFSIPNGATTIEGVKVCYTARASIADKIVVNVLHFISGSKSSVTMADSEIFWGTGLTQYCKGGSGSLWGNTWEPSDFNTSGFSVFFECENYESNLDVLSEIDCLCVEVYYH